MLTDLDLIDSLIVNMGTFVAIFDAFSCVLPFWSQWIHIIVKPLATLLDLIPYPRITLGHALPGSGGRIRE